MCGAALSVAADVGGGVVTASISMQVTEDIEDICARILALHPSAIVGLEGFQGSGKSTLAVQLSERLSVAVFQLDRFARMFDPSPPYVECLDISALKQALELRQQSTLTIVEGICLRDVLARVDLAATILIYVKRVGTNGLWYDGMRLDKYQAGDRIPEDDEELYRSDMKYHAKVCPHEKADLIYVRATDD
jgi:hypothetical protein